MLVSIIIRTLNEEYYLDELLKGISNQNKNGFDVEVVICIAMMNSKNTERIL